jgi:protocatechuate 3,4-dioxygenase beta subunit
MNAASKSLLALIVLVLAALGFYLLGTGDTPEPGPSEETHTQPVVERAPDPTTEAVPTQPAVAPLTRTEIEDRKPAEFPQGFRGQVVDPAGAPVAGAAIYVVEGVGTNIFQIMQWQAKGIVLPPLARGKTDAAGSFALGVDLVDETKAFELRVVTEHFVEGKVPGLHLVAGKWYEFPEPIQLKRGAVLQGRVTIAGSGGLPVPDAEVTLKPASGLPDVTPTPGRELGIPIRADASGAYRIDNAPPGIAHVAAVAPGFARHEQQNVQIHENSTNDVHFELSSGLSIAGIVTDAAGSPIHNVKLSAIAISSKTPSTAETRSQGDGRFEILGLLEGPYIVKWAALGFIGDEVKPIQAGDKEVKVVVEKQGSARIQVFDKNNRVLTRFGLTLKTYFEGQQHYGLTDIPTVQARTDRDGVATVEGVNPGSYVFQVEAPAHAMAYSDPFQVVLGVEAPLVIVRLDEGGILEGLVQGPNGAPASGVAVATIPNEYDENPFTRMFEGMMPVKITRRTVQTDGQGRYRITLLNPGAYQIKFTHPEFFDVFQKGHQVQAGQTTTVPTVAMKTGTVVEGLVLVDGKPGGQVKVTISPLTDPTVPQTTSGFHCEVFSDAEGKWVMPKRVPPGRYQVVGMRQIAENPLLSLLDVMKSKQEVEIGGQARISVIVRIQTQ